MIGWPFIQRNTAVDVNYNSHNGVLKTLDELSEIRRKEVVTVERDTNGDLTVCWSSALEPEMIYTGTAPGAMDLQMTMVVEHGHYKATIVGLDRSRRHFVTLVLRDGSKIVAGERILPLPGTHNFRDLGGYETVDGRRVKWGKLYRSDHLGGLTRADRNYLEMLKVCQVYDLRTMAEVDKNPDRLPSSITYNHLPVFTYDPLDKAAILLQRDHLYDVMAAMYRSGIELGAMTCAMIVRQLAQNENLPAVIHCSAGKDRAGLISALVLLALGVPVETVIDDYTLTNLSIDHLVSSVKREMVWYQPFGLSVEHFYPLLTAPASLMREVLEYLSDQYGTVEDYLCLKGGLKRKYLRQLRDSLLE